MEKIEVYSGIAPNLDCIGIEGYEFYGTFESFQHFKEYLESLPKNKKPSVFIGFRIGNLYYSYDLELLGDKKKAWGLE